MTLRWTMIAAAAGIAGLAAYAHAQTRYAVIDLGTLGGDALTSAPGSAACSVNASGDVVGLSVLADGAGSLAAYVWSNGAMTELDPGIVADIAQAHSINDVGVVVGVAQTLGDVNATAIMWNGSSPTVLGQFDAVDVNASSAVAGRRMVGPMGAQTMAVARLGTSLIDLGTLGGGSSTAYAIDDASRVVGSADDATGRRRPFIWTGALHDLGTIGGASGEALDIAPNGWIAGWSLTADGRPHATRWQVDASGAVLSTMDLGELSGGFSYAHGIDDAGRCVGTSDSRAVLWEGGAVIDLNDRTPSGSGWMLQAATAINADAIVGRGMHRGLPRAFLMRPAAPADLNADGFVNADDLFDLLGQWGPCPDCLADLNGDGVVNADDLFMLLGDWSV